MESAVEDVEEPSIGSRGTDAVSHADETTSKETPDVAKSLDVVETWSEGTSVHGVPYALNREHFLRWKRVLWWTVLIAFSVIMFWLVAILIQEYLEYETETTTYWLSPDTMPFPDVVVCNVNPFQVSRINNLGISFPRNEEEVEALSQPLEDFFFDGGSTSFDNTYPSRDVWIPEITPLGLCWRFSTNQTVFRPGADGGLYFFASIQQSEYSNTTQVAGAYVFIVDRGNMISKQTPAVLVQPGARNVIYMRRTVYNRERDEPWSTCRSDPTMYTQPECRALCRYKFLSEQCNCRALGDNRPEVNKSLDYCIPGAPCDKTDESAAYLANCNCRQPPCHEIVYTTQTNVLQLAENFLLAFEERLNITEEVFRSNVLQVLINYDSIRQEVVEETKVQTPAGLLASIGGQMGLWAGISFISILEVLGELFVFRLVPRLWGDRRLYGLGSKQKTA